MKKSCIIGLVALLLAPMQPVNAQNVYEIPASKTYVTLSYFEVPPVGGDTIKVLADRTETLKFIDLMGSPGNPIVIINSGGQVDIETTAFGALQFSDCQHIKVTGNGDPDVFYGFRLLGAECGLQFSGYCSDVEACFVEIRGTEEVFFGIYAKKDFGGNPPIPYPQFNNLIIHDTYIHHVSEGMYIGETTSPGMEFRHVKVYNNIVTDTHRESIQIANAVEDVEVYNNLMINAGTQSLDGQSNLLQIGGNTVAKVYNNIMITAPAYGIINLGMGNNYLHNNYMEDCKGVFIDNRYIPDVGTPVSVKGNYFLSTLGSEVVRNMNEINMIYVEDNQYNTPIPFFTNVSDLPPVLIEQNNNLVNLESLEFSIVDGKYVRAENMPEAYLQLGPVYDTDPVIEEPPVILSRIPLSESSITDLVPGGSLTSPTCLADEQTLDPMLDEHPRSKTWVPAKNTRNGPFMAEIDLSELWEIKKIALHDEKREGLLEVAAFVDGQWISLFEDPCLGTDTWNFHDVTCLTSKLRLIMTSSVKAEINEIALYGIAQASSLKSLNQNSAVKDQGLLNIPEARIFPNPASDEVYIQTDLHNPVISLYSLTGEMLLDKLPARFSVSNLQNGVYLVKVSDPENGTSVVNRFVINH